MQIQSESILKFNTCILIGIISCCFLASIMGCGLLDYDVEVVNEIDEPIDFYIDGDKRGSVDANSSRTFSVSRGTHVFEARRGPIVVTSRTIDIDSDVTWTVFLK